MPFKLPRLPYGERSNDPSEADQNFRFRFNIAVRRANPLLIGFTTALIVCMIPLTLILFQQNEVKANQRALAISGIQARHQRFEAASLLCDLDAVIEGLIIGNPGARVPPDVSARLHSVDCPKLLSEVIRSLGHDATRPERARAAEG